MSALVPLVTSTGPLLDRASAGVRALVNAVSRREEDYFEEGQFNAAHVKKELQDASEEVKLRALKRLLAAHAAGVDVSGLLPEVVKAIAMPSLEMKRLVYLFLILHAERSRDVALLSINSFQKDLADRNQVIRATSLKALASIRLLEVVQLLMAALRRAAADSSPFVRRTAAQCIMKIYTLDPDQYQELEKIVLILLKDIEISVVGAALVAFRELCMRHGAADCLRLHGDQLSSPQQHQAQWNVSRTVEEQYGNHNERQFQQGQEEEKKNERERMMLLQQQMTGYTRSTDGTNVWKGHQKELKGGEQLHWKGGEEEEEYGEMSRQHIDVSPHSSFNEYQREKGRHNHYDDREIHSGAATEATTSENSLRAHRVLPYHLQSYATTAAMKKAVKAQVCALGLLHPHYRRLQESMLHLEPYAQVVAIDIFLRYVRIFFAEPAATLKKKKEEWKQGEKQQHMPQGGTHSVRGVFADRCSPRRGEEEDSGDETFTYEAFVADTPENHLPADLRKFLSNLAQLLYSESVAVVAAVAAAFYYLLPPAAWKPVIQPLLRCIYTSSVEVREPLLHIAAALAGAAPTLFIPCFRSFFLACNDPSCVKQGKLQVLKYLLFSPLFDTAAARTGEAAVLPQLLLQELSTYIRWPGDPLLLSTCFNFLVNIAVRFPSAQSSCMQIFVQFLDTASSCALASEAVLALQVVLQQQQQQLQQQEQQRHEGKRLRCRDTTIVYGARDAVDKNEGITDWTNKKITFRGSDVRMKTGKGQQLGWLVLQLAMHLSRVIQGAAARASIVWMVGEYQREVGWVAADVFRQLAKSFTTEAEEVKLQILLLGLKVWAFHWDNKQSLVHELQQQQEQKRFPANPEEEEEIKFSSESAIGSAATGVLPEAAGDTGRNKSEKEVEIDGVPLLHNGVVIPAVNDGSEQQQQRHTGMHSAPRPEEAKTIKTSPGHVMKQQHQQQGNSKEKKEDVQRYLLPPPTPEESAKAFPRLDNMLKYVCEAASFDMSYDVRDVARLYFALSRLALTGKAHDKKQESSKRKEGSIASSKNSRRFDNNNSVTSCSNMVQQNDNTTASSSNEENNDGSGSVKGSNNAVLAQENEMLDTLGGCGGEMFKSTTSEAIADMSHFAQQYIRRLAMGSIGGQRNDLQSKIQTRNSGRGAATIVSALTTQENAERRDVYSMRKEDGRDLSERTRQSLRGNTHLTSTGNNNSRFFTENELSSCRLWEEHNDRKNAVRHPSSLLLGSLSELLGHRMHGYIELPPFAATNSPDELRTVEQTVAPSGVAQCLTRGSAVGGAGKEQSGPLLSNHYADIQEVKAISSDDIVIKRSAAALMGRDTNAKADLTSLDLDSFYADSPQCNDVPATGLPIGSDSVTAPSTTATPTGAAVVSEAGYAFTSLLHENSTFLPSSSVGVSRTFPGTQRENILQQQQQNLWDMFGETYVNGDGEWSIRQCQQQSNDDVTVAQFEAQTAVRFTGAAGAASVGSTGIVATAQGREQDGGVAVAGEDEESDEEKDFVSVSR